MTLDALRVAAKALLRRHEGVRSRMYFDTLGIPTIAVGLNLRRADARGRLAAIGAGYDAVMAGLALTPEQIDELLEQDLDDVLIDLRKCLADFDTYPDEAKLALIDLRFNRGGTGFRDHRLMLAAVRARSFAKAGRLLEVTQPWASQVGKRAKALGDLFRRAEEVACRSSTK